MLHARQLWRHLPSHTDCCCRPVSHAASSSIHCRLHLSQSSVSPSFRLVALCQRLFSSSTSATPFRVAIFGRPNVGKSTLFNRLVGRRIALTDSTPGVTRDPLQHTAHLAGLHFTVTDTAGLEPVHSFLSQPPSSSQLVHKQPPSPSLQQHIQQLTRRILSDCHIALFLIDARLPLTHEDVQYARMVRSQHYTVATAAEGTPHRQRRPVVLVANKVEDGVDRDRLPGLSGVYQLGLGEPIELSAEHGEGLAGLHNVLDQHMRTLAAEWRAANEVELGEEQSTAEDDVDKPVIDMAIVGRPNTGKSTLLNALLNYERALTGPQPGITRDPIRSLLPSASHPSYRFHVVDTAGIRGGVIRREGETRVDAEAMRLSMRAIDRANIVVLVLDVSGATQLESGNRQSERRGVGREDEQEALLLSKVTGIVSQQDLAIAKRATDEGRGLVVALNKVDLLGAEDKQQVLRGLRLLLDRTLPQVKDVPLIPLSAATTLHLSTLLPSIVWVYERWNKAIPTARLTDWLLRLQSFRPHPSFKGRRIRFKFMRQVAVRPPTFSVWVGGGRSGRGTGEMDGVSDDWLRMMRAMLCQEFGLEGVNVRVKLRRGEVRDREERRQEARARDQREEVDRTRQREIEVEDGEAEDGDAEKEAEMEAEEGREDVDIHGYRVRTTEEVEEEEEGEMDDETEEVGGSADAVGDKADKNVQSSPVRLPRFIPFAEDPDRIAAVAAATTPSASSSATALPPVPGFMSPSPLAVATSNTSLSFPRHRHRPSHSHLSFLPLPPPQPPSTSLPWSERRVVQQKKTERRSTAIREKREQAQFVSVGAWRKWKEAEEERRQRYLKRERKIVAGRERKAAGSKARERDVTVIPVQDEEQEQDVSRGGWYRRGGKSRYQRQ